MERVKAARGERLRCQGWRQEAILRLLENNLENGENPEELIIYKATAKAARDWTSYERIVRSLKELAADETLVVQSGKPIGRFRTTVDAPLVLMANGNIVAEWADAENASALEAKGLTVSPGMTAAAWQYIGSQGILQGTYETFAAVGRHHFGGSLKGRLIVTAGCGGMGGAQPLAGKLAGAAILVIDVDRRRIERRLSIGYCDRITASLNEALSWLETATSAGDALSVGLVGNAADVLPDLLRQGVHPDIVTDQTSTEPDRGYFPPGWTVAETLRTRASQPQEAVRRAKEGIAKHVRAMLAFLDQGSIVFEYGNNLRQQAAKAGVHDAFRMPGFVEQYIRPFFFTGRGPFRWISITGSAADIHAIDDLVIALFGDSHPVSAWIRTAREHVPFQGLPARIGWLGHGERTKLALAVNAAVARGDLTGPVAFTRDHLDAGSVAFPHRETENMRDGSDAIADWPLLNALLNCACGADLVAIHGLSEYGQSAGVTVVADGSEGAAQRIERVFNADTGLGVHRYADAGYEEAVAARHNFQLDLFRQDAP